MQYVYNIYLLTISFWNVLCSLYILQSNNRLVPYVVDIACEEAMLETNYQTGKDHWIQMGTAAADLKKIRTWKKVS